MTRKTARQSRSTAATLFRWLLFTLFGGLAALAAGGYALYRHLEPQLPDVEVLSDIRYQIPMSVYSKDNLLMAEYGEMKRIPVGVPDTPKQMVQAFLAAEDNRFFDHPGVDYQGIARAAVTYLRTGEKRQGGSTITMQVARNFFLSSEKTLTRKVKEIMLAVKIESKLPKESILELYLNKIYFGHHAYGVGAAAQVYYGKAVQDLELPEIAMIAGLPKAPSSFNPIVNPERALSRRNYVLNRMRKLGFITEAQFHKAFNAPETAKLHIRPVELDAPYIAEMVRNEMYRQYGEDAYTHGYKVYTTIDSKMHALVEKSLRLGLHDYDERHGYRSKKTQRIDLKKLKTPADWDARLAEMQKIGETVPGLVLGFKDGGADVYLGAGQHTNLGLNGTRWTHRGPKELFKPGDLIRLRKDNDNEWRLSQIPEAEGALVSVDAKSGAVVALAGGYDFALSTFNRATQAQRQPGSGFKPVLYAAALTEGYTPSSVVNDAPIVYADPSQAGGVWRPKNYSGRYYGPTRLRVALAKSRNLVSVRLLKSIGLKKAIAMAEDFGFEPQELPKSMPLALGAGSATPLRMAQVYSVFANGGFRVEPYFIERIETDEGRLIYQATPGLACPDCVNSGDPKGNLAPRVISPQVHYMMNSMLLDVVRMGTATQALELGRSDIAGKTGTTNEYRDAWFNGYVPGLVTVAWIGFDSSKSLGHGETGGEAALPMWMRFMKEALKDVPDNGFPVPSGLTTVRVDGGGKNGSNFEVYPAGRQPRNIVPKRPRPANPGGSSAQDDGGGGGGGAKSLESLF
ncbi:penicillin-binding protein 1A [Methylomagnum ishizawai]|uniref:penicillin-binding protein 1A n=1 Tax=Methylomagnum ishizawai TaxID=1760988 RepID=UPI001C3304CC|nr:penicillin-binding protein 1A [Methylomagnum ishizawai]BBL76512.1 penicillin-binding protein 1A [Methylomagnum ishizawai]